MDPFYQIAVTGFATPAEAVAGVSGFRLLSHIYWLLHFLGVEGIGMDGYI